MIVTAISQIAEVICPYCDSWWHDEFEDIGTFEDQCEMCRKEFLSMKINYEKMTAEINLMENAVYVVKDGKLQERSPNPQADMGSRVLAGRVTSLVTLSWRRILNFNR